MTHCRIPPVVPGTRPALAAIEREIVEQRGRVSLLYQVLLNSAPVAAGWEKLLTAVRNQSTVPPALREIVILRVAVLNRAAFEFDAHVPHAERAGVTAAKIDAVRTLAPGAADVATAAPAFDADERLVLALTDAMTRDVDVAEALMARVKARFDARAVLELVTTVAAYNMVSRVLVALDIRH